jgi:peptidoglycan LD-endopeptidase CwlK
MTNRKRTLSSPPADSTLTFAEAVSGSAAPAVVLATLRLIEVDYYGFDSRLHRGQLVVASAIEKDIHEIFSLIREVRFPLNSVIPVVHYQWSDEASMEANNSSAFNYRLIAGTNRLSLHAFGVAVDLNPRQNPVIYEDGQIQPSGAIYRPEAPGTLTESSPIVKAFLQRGWNWGGHFQHFRDYHHFERATLPPL